MQSVKIIQGNPCKYGHDGKRYKSGACVECSIELSQRQRKQPGYRDRKRTYYQNYKLKPENLAADRDRHARWRKTEKGKRSVSAYYFKAMYGLTLEQIEAMVIKQDNACAICGKSGLTERYKRLSVDHNHKTKAVRELLCDDCNVGLGVFGENPERLEAAAAYLRRHGG